MKHCCYCKQTLPLAAFGPNAARKDGLQTYCRSCGKASQPARDAAHWAKHKDKERQRNAAYRQTPKEQQRQRDKAAARRINEPHKIRAWNAQRKKHVLRATPPWADRQSIQKVYEKAQRLTEQTGIPHHVDHDIPLRGRLVSGLHVLANLRVLRFDDNLAKSNRYEN